MEEYIAVKRVSAEPLTKAEFEEKIGKKLPDSVLPDEPGYKVVYQDGYVSWCPKAQFESANRPIGDGKATFGEAIENMKTGWKMARSGWNGKGMHLELQLPDEYSKMSLPYIYMKTVRGDLVPWLASQTDMLAEDWEIVQNPLDA